MDTPYKNIQPVLIHAIQSYKEKLSTTKSEVASCHATPSYHETPDVNDSLKLWDDFQLWLHYENKEPDFEQFLNGSQRRSYIIIREFFDSIWHDDTDPRGVINRYLHGERGSELVDGKGIGDITYAKAIAFLFEYEMDPNSSLAYSLGGVLAWRLEAEKKTAAQKIGYSCLTFFRVKEGDADRGRRREQGLGFILDDYDVEDSGGPRMPFYLWDRKQRRTVVVHELASRPRFICISHTWGRWESGGSIRLEGVPWRLPYNSRFDVRDLPSMFDKADMPTNYVWFDLVCIPQGDSDPDRQSKEIAKQADIFVNAVGCVAWLNDVKSWNKVLSAPNWLGLAFLRSGSGLAFPDSDKYIQMVEDEANDASDLFQKMNFIPKGQSMAYPTSEIVPSSTEGKKSFHFRYCCSRTIEECETGRRLCKMQTRTGSIYDFAALFGFPDWISSLWTLQEACLSPNMSLASS